jgi:ABC-type nitrate/sulfonate/bicarbonate transport system permease component
MIFYSHIQATAFEMLLSVLLALPLSCILALSFKYSPSIKKILMPCFVLLQNLPMFVLAPLLLSCFGWGLFSILLPTILMLAFPLTLSFNKGLEATPTDVINFYKCHGASEFKILISIRVPFALPYFFSGLKIAAASSATGALAGEWAGAQKGLGVLMQIFRRQFDIEGVFICLACTVGLSLLFYTIATLVEKMILFGCYGFKKRMLVS